MLYDGKGCIGVDEMESLVVDSVCYDVFKFIDVVFVGDGGCVLCVLVGLCVEGEDFILMMGWVVN